MEDETKEEGNVKSITTEYEDHELIVESEEEFREETEDEIKEEEEDSPKHFDTFPTMKELRYHEWLLKIPRLPWMKAMAGPGRKPSNLEKICNFVGRVQGLKVFVGNFTYECDFMVLEDTTSVIDHDLGSVTFEKPFVKATDLVYNKEEGIITFEKDKEKIIHYFERDDVADMDQVVKTSKHGDDGGVNKHTSSSWNEDSKSDDEVDEVLFPEDVDATTSLCNLDAVASHRYKQNLPRSPAVKLCRLVYPEIGRKDKG
nr:protein kinase-like domain, concanavalin A-like lectin/glucanase domain protein [Tanacetum cinerariifolium]